MTAEAPPDVEALFRLLIEILAPAQRSKLALLLEDADGDEAAKAMKARARIATP